MISENESFSDASKNIFNNSNFFLKYWQFENSSWKFTYGVSFGLGLCLEIVNVFGHVSVIFVFCPETAHVIAFAREIESVFFLNYFRVF